MPASLPHDLNWRLLFGAGFLAFFYLRWHYVNKAKKEPVALSRVDRQERLLLGLMFVGWMALPLIWLWKTVHLYEDYQFPLSQPFKVDVY